MNITTGSVGNSPIFVEKAENVIIELNTNAPKEYEGLHDIYVVSEQNNRREIPLYDVGGRIGEPGIKVDPDKVRGIILSEQPDIPSPLFDPNEETQQIADNLLEFFAGEVEAGRLSKSLAPLQSGVGSVANAVLSGMKDSQFRDIEVYSEVLHDDIFDLINAGEVKFASATALSLSKKRIGR